GKLLKGLLPTAKALCLQLLVASTKEQDYSINFVVLAIRPTFFSLKQHGGSLAHMAFFLYQIAHRGNSSAAISATMPNMRPCRRLSSFFLSVLNSTVLTSVPNEDLSAFNTLGLPSRAEA